MKSGLLLNAIDPTIGGVLISGQKGTGKSTAVRALTRVLPEIEVVKDCPYNCSPTDDRFMCRSCGERLREGKELSSVMRAMPLVELPLSATEDRVIGTLHVEEILKTGKRRFEPGLLAAANRGVLYVDEVNLLDDHLVDILLDGAASGVNIIEREGISHQHPAHFILVGTMNPEEGELRPQFLDRFGLSLRVESVAGERRRREIVDRRLAFDLDPALFVERFNPDESLLSEQVRTARQQVNQITISDKMIALAVKLSTEIKTQGHRADITIIKAARVLAAFLEEQTVNAAHIFEAARFVLPHRIANVALASPKLIEAKLEETISKVAGQRTEQNYNSESDYVREEWGDIPDEVPGAVAASHVRMMFSFLNEKEVVFDADELICIDDLDLDSVQVGGGIRGKVETSHTAAASGQFIRAESIKTGERYYHIAADATIRAALLRQAEGRSLDSFQVSEDDLRKKVFSRPIKTLIVLLVDSSDSMGDDATYARIKAAKGTVLAILGKAYQKRHRVGMVTFRGEAAEIILPPTTSLTLAGKCLKTLPTGGSTPFSDGLMKAWQMVKTERLKDPLIRPLLVILSDGEANVPYEKHRNLTEVSEELLTIGALVGKDDISSLVIDTRPLRQPSPSMKELSNSLGGTHHHISQLKTDGVLRAVAEFR